LQRSVNDNIEIHNNYKTKVHNIVYFCFAKNPV